MWGTCTRCNRDVDGVTHELSRAGVCSVCEARTIDIRDMDAAVLDRQIREEYPDAIDITPDLRALYLGRLLMYRDMLLHLRVNLSKSGIFDSGPANDDIRKRCTWQKWQTVRQAPPMERIAN